MLFNIKIAKFLSQIQKLHDKTLKEPNTFEFKLKNLEGKTYTLENAGAIVAYSFINQLSIGNLLTNLKTLQFFQQKKFVVLVSKKAT